MLADDAARAEGERQAGLISAVNLGSHGKPEEIRRVIKSLTNAAKRGETPENAMGVEELLKGKL
jgi:hypothetical protein